MRILIIPFIAINLMLTLSACLNESSILNYESLSIEDIQLGKPFETMSHIGKAHKFHEGDAAASADKICFNLQGGGVIVASSNHEMGDGTIDMVRIEHANFRTYYMNSYEKLSSYHLCGTSKLSSDHLNIPYGIRLGQTRREVIERIGEGKNVSQPNDGLLTLQYSQSIEMPVDAAFPAWWIARECGTPIRHQGLSVYFDESDRVIGISVWKTEPSC